MPRQEAIPDRRSTEARLVRPMAALALLAGMCLSPRFARAGDEEFSAPVQRFRAGAVLSATDGAALQLRIDTTAAGEVPEAQRVGYLGARVLARLAVGDAAAALREARDMRIAAPGAPDGALLLLAAATAAGDGELADGAIRQLREFKDLDQKPIAAAARRLKQVGTKAPEVTIRTEDGGAVAVADRSGTLLLVDFWTLRARPGAETLAGLQRLHEALKARLDVTMIGVNTDAGTRLNEARDFATANKYAWPQHYEERSAEAPITHRAFQAGAPPWTVLVDGDGYIRAIGDPASPALHYAVRAAIAEMNGQFPPLPPRTTDGRVLAPRKPTPAKPSEPPPAPAPPRPDAAPPSNPPPLPPPPPAPAPPQGNLPSNPEAASLLRQARVYLKTGKRTDAKRLLQEIVDKYPGTHEAKEAAYLLQGL